MNHLKCDIVIILALIVECSCYRFELFRQVFTFFFFRYLYSVSIHRFIPMSDCARAHSAHIHSKYTRIDFVCRFLRRWRDDNLIKNKTEWKKKTENRKNKGKCKRA